MNGRTANYWPAALILAIGLLLTAGTSVLMKQRVEAEAISRFNFACDQLTLKVQERLAAFELILRGGAAIFAASENVERREWKAYAETLRASKSIAGIQGVGFAPRIAAEQLDAHLQRLQAEGLADYAITPPGPRASYAPVIYAEPLGGKALDSFGLDLFSDPTCRFAMEMAQVSNMATLSGKTTLPARVPDAKTRAQSGAMLFVPVYRQDALRDTQQLTPQRTAQQRRAATIGWVYSPLLVNELFMSILGPWDDQEGKSLDLNVYDGFPPSSALLLFDSADGKAPDPGSLFYQTRVIDFNGHLWQLVFDRGTRGAGIDYAPAWLTLGSGIVLSGLLCALMLSIFNTRARALRIAGELTEEISIRETQLKQSEAKLSEILENVDAYIYLKDMQGRYLFANRPVLELFGTPLDEVVGCGDEKFFAAETVARIRDNDRRVLDAGQTVRTEETNINTRDGVASTYFSVKVPLRDSRGNIYALCGVSTDITERRKVAEALQKEQRFSKLLLDSLPGIFYLYTYPECRLVLWNRQHETILGYSAEEMNGRHVTDWHRPEAKESVIAAVEEIMKTGQSLMESSLHAKDGHPVYFVLTGVRFDTPEQSYFMGIGVDISRRKQAEDELHLAASVFSHAREGIMITDVDGTIIDANDSFTRITGYSRDEALGRNPRFLSSGRQDAAFYSELWRSLREKGHWYGEIWNRRKNGEIYAEMQNISTVRDAQGTTRQYVALFSDITAIKEHERKLEHIAHYDVLTTLPNRVLLADRLHQAMVQAQRRGKLLAVAYLDLDGFKSVNDSHGHETGDLLLIALASRMKDTLREGDTLARLGGDEFVAVLLDLADISASVPMLGRLLAAAALPVHVGPLVLQVSASLGVTFYPQIDDVDADQLLRQSDQAMYQAKLAGKNRYHIFDADLDRSVRGHHESLQHIRRALNENEFVLHYQPKVNMRTGLIIGAEALIRWQHPEKGLLPPGTFLPVIEDHPLAIEVGEWVIDSALRQIEHWKAAGLDLPLSVNVGARQLQHPDFVDRLHTILAAHPSLKPGDLQIEVLETSALEDLARISSIIDACRDIGVNFSLDDFGTGYSSLTYLKRLSVTQLKIDQSFVRNMLDDPDDLAILEGVLGLASAFRRQVIAEGVETVEHGELLLQLGCELAQGYGIARPMPASEVARWAGTWRPDALWDNKPPINRNDVPLLFASSEHRAWINALGSHLDGTREAPPALDHHLCRFGQWLTGEGRERHADKSNYLVIERLHLQIHDLAKELCARHLLGETPQALARLKEIHALRDALLEQMKILARQSLA